jgi:hypothetical protein
MKDLCGGVCTQEYPYHTATLHSTVITSIKCIKLNYEKQYSYIFYASQVSDIILEVIGVKYLDTT